MKEIRTANVFPALPTPDDVRTYVRREPRDNFRTHRLMTVCTCTVSHHLPQVSATVHNLSVFIHGSVGPALALACDINTSLPTRIELPENGLKWSDFPMPKVCFRKLWLGWRGCHNLHAALPRAERGPKKKKKRARKYAPQTSEPESAPCHRSLRGLPKDLI